MDKEFITEDLLSELDEIMGGNLGVEEVLVEDGVNDELVKGYEEVLTNFNEDVGLSNFEKAMIEKQKVKGLEYENESLILYYYATGLTAEEIKARTGFHLSKIKSVASKCDLNGDKMLEQLQMRLGNNKLITDVVKGEKYNFLEDFALEKVYEMLKYVDWTDVENNAPTMLISLLKVFGERTKARSDALTRLKDIDIKRLSLNLDDNKQDIVLEVTDEEMDLLKGIDLPKK